MEKTVIKTGKTVDEAIEAALSELGCTKEQATVEVVEEGTEGGFLGLGRKDAEVKVTFNSEEAGEEAAASDDSDVRRSTGRTHGTGIFVDVSSFCLHIHSE